MNKELEKLANSAINDLFDSGIILNANEIQIIKELAELASLRGVVDYQSEQIGAYKK